MKADCHFIWRVTGSFTYRHVSGRLQGPGGCMETFHVAANDLEQAVELFKAAILSRKGVAAGTDHTFRVTKAEQLDELVWYPA